MAPLEGFLGETSFDGQLYELIVRQVAVEAVVVQFHVDLRHVHYRHHVGGGDGSMPKSCWHGEQMWIY